MKFLLFHAIQPDFVVRGQHDWKSFLREAALLNLPEGGEALAPNIWLLPDHTETERELGRLGHRWEIATRIRAFSGASPWQPLSPAP
ncbi:MAG: hypothetical protein KGJ66_05315 [Alphaproteobacteria bacterium]|nr:hypothetical protein [Alphaproteobacteria bacterium]